LIADCANLVAAGKIYGSPRSYPPGEPTIRNSLRRLYIKLARLWYRLVTLKSSPRKIALGFALGVFIAHTPTLGVQTILTLSLAALLKVNPISATVGVYMSNPVTMVPMYALCYRVGAWVVNASPGNGLEVSGEGFFWGLLSLGKTGLTWMWVEFVGALIVGSLNAIIAYFVAMFAVVRFRRARLNRHMKEMKERLEEDPQDEDQQPDR
jgi:hypothetical protein